MRVSLPLPPIKVSAAEPPLIEFARELPVILTAVVRVEAFIVFIVLPAVTGDLVEFVTLSVVEVEESLPITVFVKEAELL